MRKTTLLKFALIIFVFFITGFLNGQIVIGKPNLGFSQACASPTFNTYDLSFVFSPETGISSSNQFVVELSDENGDFSNPTVLHTTAAGEITTTPATINFQFPTTISGEAFQIRIKSTAPVATSTKSDSFAAYYKAQDTPFSINNLIGNAAYCAGGSYLLTIDNPGTGSNDSPLNYPGLSFKWYKQTSETTSVYVADGESLEVSEPGTYFVETDYGTCTSDSFSNRVSVSEAGSTTETGINSSLGNPFCPEGGPTTLTTVTGENYEWFKDGVAIPDSNLQSITTDEAGDYSVNIDLGECSTNANITLESEAFSSEIDTPEVSFLNENETIIVTITSSATSPTYSWFLNDSLIEGEISNSYEVTQTGDYKAVISQTQGCSATKEFLFTVMSTEDIEEIPNVISPNGDGINDTWIIPQQYLSGTNTSVIIFNSQGKVVLETTSYTNNWPQEQITNQAVNPVFYYIISNPEQKERKGSITVLN